LEAVLFVFERAFLDFLGIRFIKQIVNELKPGIGNCFRRQTKGEQVNLHFCF